MYTFRQSLLLSFVDKFVLTLIGLSLIFLYNRYMIQHRFSNDLVTRIATDRLDVLSVAWDKYYEIDALNGDLFLIFMDASNKKFKTADEYQKYIKPEADPILAEMSRKSSELFAYLDTSRYMLGDELFLRINNKCIALFKLNQAFMAKDTKKCEELAKMLYENKPDIEQFMEE